MRASTELFDLIQSLDGGEKGYFKRHSLIKSNESKNYLLLFDAIARQKIYDEDKLQEKFKNEPFARQFAVAKSYLHGRILKSLDSFHTSEQEDIRSRLHYTEIYFKKGLFGQALKEVIKCKSLAASYDLYFFLPEILHWELTLAEQKYDLKEMQRILREYDTTLTLLKNIHTYRTLSARISILSEQYRKSALKNHLGRLRKIMECPELRNERHATSFTSKIYFLCTHANYNIAIGNIDKAQNWFIQALDLFHAFPEKMRNKFPGYLSITANLLELLAENHDLEDIPYRLEKIKSAVAGVRNRSHRARAFFICNYHLLEYLQLTGKFEKARKLIPVILNEYKIHERSLNSIEKILLHIRIAFIHFANGSFSECLKHVNFIRNHISLTIRPDLERFLSIFYIIIHYEMKHADLLPHLINSAQRFLNKDGNASRFETILMAFFRTSIVKGISGEKLNESFRKLKRDLTPISEDINEKHAFQFFDYLGWIESNLQKVPLADIVKSKIRK